MSNTGSNLKLKTAARFTLSGLALTALAVLAVLYNGKPLQSFLAVAVCGGVFALSMSAANAALQKQLGESSGRKAAQWVLWIVAAVYVGALIYLLLLMPASRQSMTAEAYYDYGKVNLIPFATVRRYINAIRRGVIPLTSAVNLLGNLLLFAPMGIWLAVLKKPFCRFFCALPLMLMVIALTELTQWAFLIGSCDVDDLILNFIGGAAGFFFAKLPFMRKRFEKYRFTVGQ